MKNIGPMLLDYIGVAVENWKIIAVIAVVAIVLIKVW
jgi:hypothetical protein